ncbi:Ig-like domain-containing protein [Halobaculum rubrum]|uniref:Ig-like domain-containing protein n=1 Tax=Halobaculum rubrum TaxID=2872158 RepID=UPI001CA46077|nr:Ig-like domain-containing protein [Halobaculum rubrum]QZX99742.1 Ig-like domain-containing protein [Halobaculum rubrum]
MTGRGDGNGERDRAVTVQIGAVILFGFLIVALSTYQATVVPDQNREVEFLHNQEVQTDMVELSSGITATGRTGDAAPATVKLGTRYPSRTFFVNPPPASGRLQTVDPPDGGNVTLENITIQSSANGEANDYWNVAANRNKSTRFIVYEPGYNLYRGAPTTRYESGVAFNRFSNGANLTLTDQGVVRGDRITLVAVSGELQRNGVSTVSVDPESISSISRRERVSGELTIVIPTTLSNETWENELLNEEIEDGWVNGTESISGEDRIRIHLNDNRNYSLGIAAVHVGSGDGPDRSAAYLDIDQRPSEMTEGTTREVVVEVRDQFGNPVSGTTVTGYASDGSFVDDTNATVRTNGDGRAIFEYTAGTANTTLNFSFADDPALAGFDASTAENASVDITVNDGGAAGTGDDAEGINPASAGEIRLEDETTNGKSVADLVLNNTANTTVNVTNARVSFYFETENKKEFDTAEIRQGGTPSATLTIGGKFERLDPEINLPPGETTVTLEFSGDAQFSRDEFFVLSLRFDNGESVTYFINAG